MADPPSGIDTPTVTVRIPGLLTRFTGGQPSIQVQAATVGDSLDGLIEAYPALEPHLHDGDGTLRPHLKLFHNGREANPGDGVALETGDDVVVLQAVSGG